MSTNRIMLDSAGVPVFSAPIINPDGQKVVDVVTDGNGVAAYTAQLAEANEVGDIVLIRFSFNREAPAGQSIQLVGFRPNITDNNLVEFVSRDTALRGYSLRLVKSNDEALKPAVLSLQYLGKDWLILAASKGWGWYAV